MFDIVMLSYNTYYSRDYGVVVNDAAREASSREGRPRALAEEKAREMAGIIGLIERDRSKSPTLFDTTRLLGQYT